jgi:hypothetical protein
MRTRARSPGLQGQRVQIWFVPLYMSSDAFVLTHMCAELCFAHSSCSSASMIHGDQACPVIPVTHAVAMALMTCALDIPNRLASARVQCRLLLFLRGQPDAGRHAFEGAWWTAVSVSRYALMRLSIARRGPRTARKGTLLHATLADTNTNALPAPSLSWADMSPTSCIV